MDPTKLYIIGRRDIPAPQQTVQVAHAMAEFMHAYGSEP